MTELRSETTDLRIVFAQGAGLEAWRSIHNTEIPSDALEPRDGEPNTAGWKAVLHALGEISTPKLRAPMSGVSAELVERLLGAMV